MFGVRLPKEIAGAAGVNAPRKDGEAKEGPRLGARRKAMPRRGDQPAKPVQRLADGGTVDRKPHGIVRGPGTGTSDSVPAEIPHGTYILPADTTERVNLSNGETKLPPKALMAVGAAAMDALRATTHRFVNEEKGASFRNGGKVCRAGVKPKMADGGMVDVSRDPATGTMSFSGGNVSGVPSYTGSAGFTPSGAGGPTQMSGIGAAAQPAATSVAPTAAPATLPGAVPAAPPATPATPSTPAAPVKSQYEQDLERRNMEATASSIVASPERDAARAQLGIQQPARRSVRPAPPPPPSSPGAPPRGPAQRITIDGQAIPGFKDGGVVRAGARRPKGYADGGLVTEEDVRQQQTPGGAVFGMYPAAAGTRLSSYATDNRLRTGTLADGSIPAPISVGVRGLPPGVQPSNAGAGRGVVNPEPALVGPSVPPPQQPATARVGAAPALATAEPAQPGSPAAEAQGARAPVATTSADRIGVMERAGAIYRDIAASQQPANLPAGYGASVMPDRQAERNAQFDREVLIDRASRIGGRGARAIMEMLASDKRTAGEVANTAAREQGATARAGMQDAREMQRIPAETTLARGRQATADAEAGVRIGAGRQQLNDAQRTAKLQAQFAAETDPTKRAALREQILLATGKDRDHPNRYTVIPGGQIIVDGQVVREPSQVLDNQTGNIVQQHAVAASAPPGDAVKKLKANPQLAAEFDRKYGAGAAQRALGSR